MNPFYSEPSWKPSCWCGNRRGFRTLTSLSRLKILGHFECFLIYQILESWKQQTKQIRNYIGKMSTNVILSKTNKTRHTLRKISPFSSLKCDSDIFRCVEIFLVSECLLGCVLTLVSPSAAVDIPSSVRGSGLRTTVD